MKSFKCALLQVPIQFEIKDQSEPRPRQPGGASPGVPPADGPGHFQLWSKTPCTDPAWESQKEAESLGDL